MSDRFLKEAQGSFLICHLETKSALSLSVLKNRWLLGGLVVSNAVQVAVVFVPFLNKTFHTVPIPLTEVLAIGAVGSVALWIEEVRKFFARRRKRQNQRPLRVGVDLSPHSDVPATVARATP